MRTLGALLAVGCAGEPPPDVPEPCTVACPTWACKRSLEIDRALEDELVHCLGWDGTAWRTSHPLLAAAGDACDPDDEQSCEIVFTTTLETGPCPDEAADCASGPDLEASVDRDPVGDGAALLAFFGDVDALCDVGPVFGLGEDDIEVGCHPVSR